MTVQKHPKYFVECSDAVIFSIEETFFSVPQDTLTRHVEFFSCMLSLPQNTPQLSTEGQKIDHPIVMHDVPIDEFEALLEMIEVADTSVPLDDMTRPWSTWRAAEGRWDPLKLILAVIKRLLDAGSAHAFVLDFARRFDRPSWVWPVIFHMCIRQEPLSKPEKDILSHHPSDRAIVGTIRVQLRRERNELDKSRFKIEMRTRELLAVLGPHLKEPHTYDVDILHPLTGLRMCIMWKKDFFPENRVGAAPFTDAQGLQIYIGTAHIHYTRNAQIPAKIIKNEASTSAIVSCTYMGAEIIQNDPLSYSLIIIDEKYMKWVSAFEGRLPDDRLPVLGGYHASSGGDLYHAYGRVGGIESPGKTSPALGGACLSFDGQEHYLKDNYFILVWRPEMIRTQLLCSFFPEVEGIIDDDRRLDEIEDWDFPL